MKRKTPQEKILGANIFSYPDFTVGFGVSPNHALRLADYTAGGESHPALKIIYLPNPFGEPIIALCGTVVKPDF